MKFFKVLLLINFFGFLVLCGATLYIWSQRIPLIEETANQAANELFEGSLRLRSVELISGWRLAITGIEGRMKTETNKVPIKMERIEMKNSLWETLRTHRSELFFQGFCPVTSAGNPISGTIEIEFSRNPITRINARLTHLSTQDYAWLDPNSFEGLSGFIEGTLQLETDTRDNIKFSFNVNSEKAGGEVPAKFLEFALPYLPKAQNIKDLGKLIASKKSVPYIQGQVQAYLAEPGKITAKVKMLFPEQNINLNLNLTILVDESHAFVRVFKLLSLFKIHQN